MQLIATLRKKLKLSQSELAQKVGIPYQTLRYIESKGRGLDLGVLCELRDTLEVSWEEFGRLLDKEFKS